MKVSFFFVTAFFAATFVSCMPGPNKTGNAGKSVIKYVPACSESPSECLDGFIKCVNLKDYDGAADYVYLESVDVLEATLRTFQDGSEPVISKFPGIPGELPAHRRYGNDDIFYTTFKTKDGRESTTAILVGKRQDCYKILSIQEPNHNLK